MMFFRSLRLPDNYHLPPTLYQLMESIVNYNNDAPVKIKDLPLNARSTIFDFDYPLDSSVSKESFEVLILKHFMMRRIGFDTLTAFKISLDAKLNEIMPKYNKMFNMLATYNLKEADTTTRTLSRDSSEEGENSLSSTGTTTGSNSTTNKSRRSDTPENQLNNVDSGLYVSEYISDNGTLSSTDSTSTSSSGTNSLEGSINEVETVSHTVPNETEVLKNFLEINSIYTNIFNELEPLFYGLAE